MIRLLILSVALLFASCSDVPAPANNANNSNNQNDAGNNTNNDPNNISDVGINDDTGSIEDMVTNTDVITAPNEEWTWIPFENSVCANGEETGIAVNLTDRSDDLVVYFSGGGACWDYVTCFTLDSAINIESGYTAASFEADAVKTASLFNRADIGNPWADFNYVFIPYCTGDVFTGTTVQTYQGIGVEEVVHHRGADNVAAFLARLGPTFVDAGTVLVSGSSAGGYGAQFNFDRFVETYPTADIHLLADAAPLIEPVAPRHTNMTSPWQQRIPDGCVGCEQSFGAWFTYLKTTYPNSRQALLTSSSDDVIGLFFNFSAGTGFDQDLIAFLDAEYNGVDNAHYYYEVGTGHTFLGAPRLHLVDGVPLLDWLEAWMTGTNWASVGR